MPRSETCHHFLRKQGKAVPEGRPEGKELAFILRVLAVKHKAKIHPDAFSALYCIPSSLPKLAGTR